jgi:hypothetical protein
MKNRDINVDQDIWYCKIRHLLVYIYEIFLLKSIKNNRNGNTY